MATVRSTDVEVTPQRISNLTSADAVAAFFAELGYDTERRAELTPESIGLAGDSAAAVRSIEVLSEDSEEFLRVVFVQLRSLTAKSRNDLARVLGRSNIEHLLVLTSDFSTIEFVLLHKRRREVRGPTRSAGIHVVPLMVAVDRKAPSGKELRALRRFTWTTRDGLEQYDKLRSVFEAAAFTEEYFCNRALFADHFLMTRLREEAAWAANPAAVFHATRELLSDAAKRLGGQSEQVIREQLFTPIFTRLGFKAKATKHAKDGGIQPDYELTGDDGGKTVAFTYPWDRWLDGPDHELDRDTPDENPGACVVTALEQGLADWIIVTNGRQWRLYSRAAHSRATNFYEVDLAEALVASGDTDPNEAFRYWWLFFRSEAFAPVAGTDGCWLDTIAEGSRDYAKALGKRLKERVFLDIFPDLAKGFLHYWRSQDKKRKTPSDAELREAFEATLTLLYRLLFLLYAEARDLLPIREAPYREASLRRIKEEIAEKAGIAESESVDRLRKAYGVKEHGLYDRLLRLCKAMDKGDASLNVPTYNGGLFITEPAAGEDRSREQRIARFLRDNKVPDQFLAVAIDRLARDPDDKTHSLVAIDYKSLEVRHLGSIYEGLLEFKLKVAAEDLTTQTEKKKEKYVPLKDAPRRRGKDPCIEVAKDEVYLSNDKAERKASGSYYTPDPIVEYIVENTVGPVLDEKLESLRGDLRKVRKTYDNEVQKATAYPVKRPSGDDWDPREFAAEKTYAAHKDLVERLFDFRTLDPAMGSGHFLVEAVDFITDRLLAFLNQFPVNPVTFMLNQTRRNILGALGEQGVSVDPDKLTEVNLLKRHVLKRCIYGVDLNPMAVELAKVSLWLDAFTIGAPLSFLDHHLRCGNSLVGATWDDLLTAIADRPMLRLNDAPLKEAIRQVLEVNRSSDATAAEVRNSASAYAQIRERLSGFGIVFDLLIGPYFGHANARGLVTEGDTLRLESKGAFLASLETDAERELVTEVTATASDPQLRFFHWEIEFPEVFFSFRDVDERQIEHKNRIAKGSAGFDAVIGNPPYVRIERLSNVLKPFLSQHFSQVYNGRGDIYFLFVFLAETLRKKGIGRIGLIVSNAWLQTAAGEELRNWITHRQSQTDIIDFEPIRPFEDADMRPSIVRVGGPAQSSGGFTLAASDINGPLSVGNWHFESTQLSTDQLKSLVSTGWSAERFANITILQKRKGFRPLKEVCGRIYSGIKPGATRAFVVPMALTDSWKASSEDRKSIFRPFYQGANCRDFSSTPPDRHLLFINSLSDYERIEDCKQHLLAHRNLLEQREEVRRGATEWFKLRSCDYLEVFERAMIAWPDTATGPRFCLLDAGAVIGNTAFCIDGRFRWLLPILNSSLGWDALKCVCQTRDERKGMMRYRLIPQSVELFPVPRLSDSDMEQLSVSADLGLITEDANRIIDNNYR